MDQRIVASYYTIRIATTPAELAKFGNVKLIGGMPVEAFIKTTEGTALSFLGQAVARSDCWGGFVKSNDGDGSPSRSTARQDPAVMQFVIFA